MSNEFSKLESSLWEAADNLRANSSLKFSEYSEPVLGLIFLKYADVRFTKAEKQIGVNTNSVFLWDLKITMQLE